MTSKPEKVVLVQLIEPLDEGQAKDLMNFLKSNSRFSFLVEGWEKFTPHEAHEGIEWK